MFEAKPAKDKSEQHNLITRLSTEHHENLKTIAKHLGISMAELTRQMIIYGIECELAKMPPKEATSHVEEMGDPVVSTDPSVDPLVK